MYQVLSKTNPGKPAASSLASRAIGHEEVSQFGPVKLRIPLITESIMFIEVEILLNETAAQLSRRLGVYPPSALCRWPLRIRLFPGDNVYQLAQSGAALYIHCKEEWTATIDGRDIVPGENR